MRAVAAAFIEIKTQKFNKKVQVKFVMLQLNRRVYDIYLKHFFNLDPSPK